MKAVYLLESDDPFVIDENREKLEQTMKEHEVVSYDCNETPMERILEDLDTYNFFSPHKLIIAKHFETFLGSNTPSGDQMKAFEHYLDHPNPENILLLVATSLDERKKTVKKIKQVAMVLDSDISIFSWIKQHLEGYRMQDDVISYFIQYCLEQKEKIKTELEKLKLYCQEKKEITKEDIDQVVMRSIDDNVFHLIDCLLQKKKEEAYTIYQEMILHNEEPLKILVLLASQFRLFLQVKILVEENKSEAEIAKDLQVHPYRVKLAREKCVRYPKERLVEYLYRLAELDYQMKNGTTYQDVGLEMFMMNL